MRFTPNRFFGTALVGLLCTGVLSTGALAQGAPPAAMDAVIDAATSWPADLRNLPAFRGQIEVDPLMAEAQANILRMMGADESDLRWFGTAGVRGSFAAPDRYVLSCRRVGRGILDHARAALAGETYPERLDLLMDFDDRDTLARVTPEAAEAAMRCDHVFRIDGEAVAVRVAISQSLGGAFADLDVTPGESGRPESLVAAGWSGDPISGIAHLAASVSPAGGHPGKVDIHAVSYSWRIEPGS